MNNMNLDIASLLAAYRSKQLKPSEVIREVIARSNAISNHVWIKRIDPQALLERATQLDSLDPATLPLYGIPFAIKDNIDLAGVATTAGCAEFAYLPDRSATVVEKLIDAGAIAIGKTNLDQFATGLVGTRSPYGVCHNSFDQRFIAGGSSSGSAVAVATGLVSFALGTDTAGSGRVPAAFNNIVGLKPSCGLLSTRGVVPACRSLDCVSIFALSSADAHQVLQVARGVDPEDSYSRDFTSRVGAVRVPANFRVGIPRREQLNFFGDADYAALFDATRERATALGWKCVEVDCSSLFAAARLLYEGPWVAERYAAIETFMRSHAEAMYPVTRTIIESGGRASAASAFRAQYRLQELKVSSSALWKEVDALLMPTAGTIYSIEQVLVDPIQLNSNLGYYTNFVNLLDLSAVAVPSGKRSDGLPFGTTLIGPSGCDEMLLQAAQRLQHASTATTGTLGAAIPADLNFESLPDNYMTMVVCGAHMKGLPLNHQLTERQGFFVRKTKTSPGYRLFALAGGPPKRPGLVRDVTMQTSIEVEVWTLPKHHVGSFIAGIPAPLGIGKVELEDGSWHSGFICEPCGTEGAQDITALGGWRNFLASLA